MWPPVVGSQHQRVVALGGIVLIVANILLASLWIVLTAVWIGLAVGPLQQQVLFHEKSVLAVGWITSVLIMIILNSLTSC